MVEHLLKRVSRVAPALALMAIAIVSGCVSTHDDEDGRGEGPDSSAPLEETHENEHIEVELLMHAYVVLEYERAFYGLDEEDVVFELEQIAGSYETELPEQKHDAFFSGLTELARGNFGAAHDLLQDALEDTQITPNPDTGYVVAVAGARRPGASMRDIELFMNFERHFMDNPRYYYHVWNALRDGPGNYTFETVRAILERTILLASESEVAWRSRRELAALQGIELREGQRFLVTAELDAAAVRMLEEQDPQSFDMLADMLAFEDNVYTDAAARVLVQAARRSQWVADTLTELSQETDNEHIARRATHILDSL